MYLPGRHSQKLDLHEDSTLQSTFLTPKAATFIQILLKVYTKRQISLKFQPSKYCVVGQEKKKFKIKLFAVGE